MIAKGTNNVTKEDDHKTREFLPKLKTYDIGDNAFVIETVFKEENAETLGSILLRLMMCEK